MPLSKTSVDAAKINSGGHFLSALLLIMTACQVSHHDRYSGAKEVGPADNNGLSDATVLIIRHAEKPPTGAGLSRAGEQRAQAYVQYFKDFTVDRPLYRRQLHHEYR